MSNPNVHHHPFGQCCECGLLGCEIGCTRQKNLCAAGEPLAANRKKLLRCIKKGARKLPVFFYGPDLVSRRASQASPYIVFRSRSVAGKPEHHWQPVRHLNVNYPGWFLGKPRPNPFKRCVSQDEREADIMDACEQSPNVAVLSAASKNSQLC
jgi:hypothetical protein